MIYAILVLSGLAGYVLLQKTGALAAIGSTLGVAVPGAPLPDSSILDTVGGNPNVGTTGVATKQYQGAFIGAASLGAAAAHGSVAGIATAGGAALGAETAGVAVVVAIGIALWQAHEQRKKQATNENQAVNAAIAQVDQVISRVFSGLNSGQIAPADAITLLAQGWSMYWDMVSKYIQPGRNGCKNGSLIPHFTGTTSYETDSYYGCTGMSAWGASCCVGSTIKASLANCILAIRNPRVSVRVLQVYPNSYGGTGRAEYTVMYNG